MAVICIPIEQAEKLKRAFANGEISIEDLFNTTSQGRVDMLAKYVGKENARFFTARLEKAILSPRQQVAVKNVVMKMFGQKPLYSGVSLEQAKGLSSLKMADLRKMTDTQRISALGKFVDDKVATRLNTSFNNLKKTGNLHLWEEKAMGTETLREDKKIKGTLGKLEALDDMGVLSATDTNMFMETFIEDQLGISLTMDEAEKISEMSQKTNDLWEKANKNWTYENKDNVVDFFKSAIDLESYQQSLVDPTAVDRINKAINIARANILASPRILRNSALYQFIPTIERHLTKRVVSLSDVKGLVNNINAKAFSAIPNKTDFNFIKNQLKMELEIYHETGIDFSRLENLQDGYRLFGGEKFVSPHGEYASKNVLDRVINGILKTPKWTAGGTDMFFASIQRADTSILMSKEIALNEANKMTFDNSKAKSDWIDKRASELLRESYSFNAKGEAGIIRTQSIFDAQLSNNTQKGGLTDLIVNLRNKINIGGIGFGQLIVPFARVGTKSLERAIGLATPVGYGESLFKINQASKIQDPAKRNAEIRKEVSLMVGNLGLLTTAFILALFLDDDDYVGAYGTNSYTETQIARARGATSGEVRIGGKWIPIRYLPLINVPLAGIMTARQRKAQGAKGIDVTASYIAVIANSILDTPLIKEAYELYNRIKKASSSTEIKKILDDLGLNGANILNWSKVRMLPSVISYDLYNVMFPPEARYDFLGNKTGTNRKWYGFREDLSNEITLEFNRLHNTGNTPTISDPSKPKLKEEMGNTEYIELLNRLKQNYADEVSSLINSSKYKSMTDEEKKSAIDKIRKTEILNKLK